MTFKKVIGSCHMLTNHNKAKQTRTKKGNPTVFFFFFTTLYLMKVHQYLPAHIVVVGMRCDAEVVYQLYITLLIYATSVTLVFFRREVKSTKTVTLNATT